MTNAATETTATVDPVEAALASALDLAAKAGRFDVVAILAGELNARRLARTPDVVALDVARARRERGQGS